MVVFDSLAKKGVPPANFFYQLCPAKKIITALDVGSSGFILDSFGFHGIVNLDAALLPDFHSGMNLNFRKKKWQVLNCNEPSILFKDIDQYI